jgi:hypothetical protein
VSSRDEVPERASQKMAQKGLISFLWSVNGIHSLVAVPKVSISYAASFCDTAVPSLLEGITLHSRRSHSTVDTYTWTMHVRTNQGDPLNVFTQ